MKVKGYKLRAIFAKGYNEVFRSHFIFPFNLAIFFSLKASFINVTRFFSLVEGIPSRLRPQLRPSVGF